jgi:hypothetical protein
MALSIGIRSRSILNGTHTVALAALATDPGITFGLELGNGAVVCHPALKRDCAGSANGAMGQAGKGTALLPFVGVHKSSDESRNLTASFRAHGGAGLSNCQPAPSPLSCGGF